MSISKAATSPATNEVVNKDAPSGSSPELDNSDTASAKRLRRNASRFLTQLDALIETTNRIMAIVIRSRERAAKELEEFFESELKVGPGETPIRVKLSTPQFRQFQKLEKSLSKAREAERLVPRSFLVSMVVQYDTFLTATVRELFKLKPEKIRNSDTSVKVIEIVKYTSVQELLQAMADEEIEDAFRGSHLNQLRWLEKRFDFKIDEKDLLIQSFIELTERRNAFVHTDARVNRQYLAACQDFPKEVPVVREIGASLAGSRLYLEGARNTLFQVGLQVQQVAWRKVRSDQTDEQDLALNEIIFDLLTREDYTLARNLSDFAAKLRDLASDRNKRLFTLNRAQSYRWSNKQDKAKAIVNEMDWTSCSALFKMAAALLLEDMPAAIRHMRDVPKTGEDGLDEEAYRTWPIFKDARKDKGFLDAFEAKFGEPLESTVIEISNDQSVSSESTREATETADAGEMPHIVSDLSSAEGHDTTAE